MLLERELTFAGARAVEQGGGWMRFEGATLPEEPNLCFAHTVMHAPTKVSGDSVNQLAGGILDYLLAALQDERVEGAWPCVFATAGGLDGLGRRASAVEKAFREKLKKRLGRVARLASPEMPAGVGAVRGLMVLFTDFGEIWLARELTRGGQRRMADDPDAPSRSYLKVEEAYGVLGYEPIEDDTVVDLGAAPGGWSYSAAKRGAQVIAIDNGPMKGGALDHPLIDHRREDAFGYRPPEGRVMDWMFCDLVEDPHHVARNLIAPWLVNGWCRRFVVMLKFGRVDAVALLREMTAPDSVFVTATTSLRVRHLNHDREEFTLVGEVRVED
ncbi:SAM-dependent methyltransferase [Synoicihabitans lomoniglobus]|uniref:SAM-dependent methyltransferase n=1 Tax=Synoicihabitans lomoniglobus TaxID=2909285 RepID=A0AAF0A0V9_9BACT|nr:rRNA methyltransferase [Opitutaceae bacterium LMO-M01]WED65308.1 SAM-dependent methyltransferase [Opitutaceae bacterium LMO-M01]